MNRNTGPTRYILERFAAALLLMAASILPALIAPTFAQGESAFVRDLKAQNAPHLAAAPKLAKEIKPPMMERDWEEKLKRKSWALSSGALSVEITLKQGGPPDALLLVAPLLSLSVDGKEALKVEGAESFPDNPVFQVQIAEMDGGNPYHEVILSTYTGGAHCCSDTRVLTSSKDGKSWSEIEAGSFDGEPLGVKDLDGDGRYEISTRDNAFLYAFGCYACSTAPLKILRLVDGKLVDTSSSPAFRGHQVASLRRIIDWAGEDMDINGFLAGYVAQKILLGEGAQAWNFMAKYYDRESDWGLETCSAKRGDKGDCPPGKTVKLNFPDALERFLKENGYKLEK